MIDGRRAVCLGVLLAVMVACGPVPRPSSSEAGPSPSSSTPPAAPSSASAPVTDPTSVPTACLSLGAGDCQRVSAIVLGVLADDDPPVRYVQVGPFACAVGDRCPATLTARPEGDVVVEFAGVPAIDVHIRFDASGAPTTDRGETFGIILAPSSVVGLPSGPQRFELGHCGIWSGIDVGGSWWDPVGLVDIEHPDAVNAAGGVLNVQDPDHATFISDGGFTVQLLRRNGPKHLPLCS